MAVLNGKNLRYTALQRLSETNSSPRKLVLIHTGLVVLLNLVVNGLSLYLSNQIGETGGLSGLGMRSILETAQTLLSYFSYLFVPFWTAGFLHAMIRLSRGQEAGTGDLMLGFRRFGRITSHALWELTILIMLCVALTYVISNLFVLTPFAKDFLALIESVEDLNALILPDGTVNMELLPMDALGRAMLPMFIMYGCAFVPAYIFLSYQFRMSLFLLVEGIERGALGSFFVSAKLMKGHKWQMLKVDLSYWWYYALELLLSVVLYLDVILPLLGVELPMDPTVAYFVTIALYGLLQMMLHYWKKPQVDVTYALAYDAIYQEALPKEPQPADHPQVP